MLFLYKRMARIGRAKMVRHHTRITAGASVVNDRKEDLHSEKGDRQDDQKVLMPYNHILRAPRGKLLPRLSLAFNHWFRLPADKLRQIDDIVQTLQNATIQLDDIQDDSVVRRGLPAAHVIYGIGSGLNAANYALIICFEKCLALNHPDAVKVFTEQVLEMHRGQGIDLYWRDVHTCPTEEEYAKMTEQKTGGLYMSAVGLMQLFSDRKEDFTQLVLALGRYFQVLNDYNNLHSDDYMANKAFCDDLTEGKFSFPLIHAINSAGVEGSFMHILRLRTHDDEVKKYCVSLLESYGSFAYTRKKLALLHEEVRMEIANLGSNPCLEEFLNAVVKTHSAPAP